MHRGTPGFVPLSAWAVWGLAWRAQMRMGLLGLVLLVGTTLGALAAPPAAVDDTAMTDEDLAATVYVLDNDTDPDFDPLIVTAVTQGTNGAVAIDPGATSVTYTPEADWFGTDTFTYTISDGHGGTDTATVTMTVLSVNDWPVALDDTATTAEDTMVAIPVLSNDSDPVEGDALTLDWVETPVYGTAEIVGAQLRFTPYADWFGTDSFWYSVTDGQGGYGLAPTGTLPPATTPGGFDLDDFNRRFPKDIYRLNRQPPYASDSNVRPPCGTGNPLRFRMRMPLRFRIAARLGKGGVPAIVTGLVIGAGIEAYVDMRWHWAHPDKSMSWYCQQTMHEPDPTAPYALPKPVVDPQRCPYCDHLPGGIGSPKSSYYWGFDNSCATGTCGTTPTWRGEVEILGPWIPSYIEALPMPENLKRSLYFSALANGLNTYGEIWEEIIYQLNVKSYKNSKIALVVYSKYVQEYLGREKGAVAQIILCDGTMLFTYSHNVDVTELEPETLEYLEQARQHVIDTEGPDHRSLKYRYCAEVLVVDAAIKRAKQLGVDWRACLSVSIIRTMWNYPQEHRDYQQTAPPCPVCNKMLELLGITFKPW